MSDDSSETDRLLRRAAGGDQEALGALLTGHEGRLRRLVLGIKAAAAGKRSLRALGRLREVLADMPGALEP